jgi:phage tail sheath protein FI
MTFLHGVYSREKPTAVIGVTPTETALPFVVGTAPVHTVAGDASVNTLVKLTSWQDVVDTFGYVHDFGRYTLIEFLYAWFRIFGFSPVLCVNVFDPSAVAGVATSTAVALVNGSGKLDVAGALVQEVNADAEGLTHYVEGTDYSLVYGEDGKPVVTRIVGGAIATATATVYVKHVVIPADKAGVASAAVITAMDKIDGAFAQFGNIPTLIAAPGYSEDPAVNAVMVGKTEEYGGGWFAYALCDASTAAADGADVHTEVSAWKSTNGYTDANQDVYWPLAKIGDDVFHQSTLWAGLLARTDHENGDLPHVTGSNKTLPITGAVVAADTSVWLTDEQANDSLNANGISTVINLGSRGWVSWGNRTAAFPGTTDPKDMWRSFRRMLIWLKNTTRLNLLQKVDEPGNYRQIESIINSMNIWLNGLSAQGALVGQPQVEFRREDNPLTDLLNGHYTFSIMVTPPTAMEAIILNWQVDVSQYDTLFS